MEQNLEIVLSLKSQQIPVSRLRWSDKGVKRFDRVVSGLGLRYLRSKMELLQYIEKNKGNQKCRNCLPLRS